MRGASSPSRGARKSRSRNEASAVYGDLASDAEVRAGEEGLVVTLVLWDQELEVKRLMKRLGLEQPLTEMFSNDKRLADLTAWDPTAESALA